MTSPGNYRNTIEQALACITKRFGTAPPDIAFVLGSGLGSFADELSDVLKIPYSEIYGFVAPQVPGHAGECLMGRIGEKRVLIFRGRFHFYEGHSMTVVTLPIRVLGAWGRPHLVVTNAAGSLRKNRAPGSLLLLSDHLNLMGSSPLRGPNLDEFGERFLDMTRTYDKDFARQAELIAGELGLSLPSGVYAALPGPSYETPAEVRMLSSLGADVVGMSTVPEVLVARHQGQRVLGLSIVTNWAAGVSSSTFETIDHKEVLENTRKAEGSFRKLLRQWVIQAH